MTHSNVPKLVTVFGGSGFVGRYVVRSLARRGYSVRVAVRRPDLAGFLQPLGNVGQIALVQANLRNRPSVARAVRGADHVVNLVGILYERGNQSFDSVQDQGARAVAEACRDVGIGLTHVSAIGADSDGRARYAATKGLAEEAVRYTVQDSTILRPSIVFGPEDGFFNKFAEISRFSPFLPLIGGGETRFQPVYVGDVAEAVARSVDGTVTAGKSWDLGGPDVLTFRECLELMLRIIGRQKPFVSVPWAVARPLGSLLSMVPFIEPMLTHDQVLLLDNDNVVSPEAEAAGLTLSGMGIEGSTLDAILPSYLVRFRPAGQFTKDMVT